MIKGLIDLKQANKIKQRRQRFSQIGLIVYGYYTLWVDISQAIIWVKHGY